MEKPEALKKVSTRKIVSMVLGTVGGFGAGEAITKLFAPALKGAKGITKFLIMIGTFAISMKIGDETQNYINDAVDDLADAMKKIEDAINGEGTVE